MRPNLTTVNRRIGNVAAVLLAVFAVVIAVTTVLTMPLTDRIYLLGPGLYPFALSILLFIACCLLFLETWSGKHDQVNLRSLIDRVAMTRPVGMFALLAACLLALPILGYVIAIFLFSFLELTLLEKERRAWWVNMLFALAVSGGVYVLFTLLEMTLPEPFWL